MEARLLEFLPGIMHSLRGYMGGSSEGMGGASPYDATTGATGGYGSPDTVPNLPNPFAQGAQSGGVGGDLGGLFSGMFGQSGGMGSGGGIGNDLLNYFLTSRTNATAPYSASEQYIKKIPTYIHQYLNPEYQAYTQQYQHPTQLMSQIGSQYQESPGYQTELSSAEQAANQAAAAGGMTGTLASQNKAASIAQEMADRGYQSYMHDALGLHGQGLSGASSMGGQMVGDLSEYAQMMAKLQAESAAAEQQKKGAQWGDLGSAFSSLLSDI